MTKDGGSAFPFEGGQNNNIQPDYGMTLRDYFAAKAMPSVYAEYMAGFRNNECAVSEGWHTGVAIDSYQIADAMIKARES